jgi:hypothetical protein
MPSHNNDVTLVVHIAEFADEFEKIVFFGKIQ